MSDPAGPVLALVGATGAVGTVMATMLSARHDCWGEVRLVSSRRSAGRRVVVRGEELVVRELTSASFDGVDVAIFCTPPEVSAHWAPPVAARGVVVVDASAAFRAEDDVPLVVPEVNPSRVRDRPRGIIAVPGCATLSVIDAVAPLHRGWGLTGLVVTACQSASREGRAGVERLYDELAVVAGSRTLGQRGGDLRAALAEALPGSSSPFAAPLALNVVPLAGVPAEDGWSTDELAVRRELRRVLDAPALAVSVTCLQVPVVTSHAVVVHATFQRPITTEDARRAIVQAPSVVLLDGDDDGDLPTPADVAGSDPAWAGRVRQALDFPHALEVFLCADNLRRGSALTALEVGELLVRELRAA